MYWSSARTKVKSTLLHVHVGCEAWIAFEPWSTGEDIRLGPAPEDPLGVVARVPSWRSRGNARDDAGSHRFGYSLRNGTVLRRQGAARRPEARIRTPGWTPGACREGITRDGRSRRHYCGHLRRPERPSGKALRQILTGRVMRSAPGWRAISRPGTNRPGIQRRIPTGIRRNSTSPHKNRHLSLVLIELRCRRAPYRSIFTVLSGTTRAPHED